MNKFVIWNRAQLHHFSFIISPPALFTGALMRGRRGRGRATAAFLMQNWEQMLWHVHFWHVHFWWFVYFDRFFFSNAVCSLWVTCERLSSSSCYLIVQWQRVKGQDPLCSFLEDCRYNSDATVSVIEFPLTQCDRSTHHFSARKTQTYTPTVNACLHQRWLWKICLPILYVLTLAINWNQRKKVKWWPDKIWRVVLCFSLLTHIEIFTPVAPVTTPDSDIRCYWMRSDELALMSVHWHTLEDIMTSLQQEGWRVRWVQVNKNTNC